MLEQRKLVVVIAKKCLLNKSDTKTETGYHEFERAIKNFIKKLFTN